MYQLPPFREDRVDAMHGLMRRHPFATLVSVCNGEICVDHLPLAIYADLSPNGTLRGHIAKGNPLWRNAGGTSNAVAIFQGPQAYVTPSWYPSKTAHGKAVPTWNYAVVHARGELAFVDDEEWLLAQVTEVTERQESHRPAPWHVSDAPADYLRRQLKGIVGIELVIQSLEGKWKVSQNKDEADRIGTARGMRMEQDSDAAAVADLVERRGA